MLASYAQALFRPRTVGQNKAISFYSDSEAIGCDCPNVMFSNLSLRRQQRVAKGILGKRTNIIFPPHGFAKVRHNDSITIRDDSEGQLLSVNWGDGGRARGLLLIIDPGRMNNRKMPRHNGTIPGRHWVDTVPHAIPKPSQTVFMEPDRRVPKP